MALALLWFLVTMPQLPRLPRLLLSALAALATMGGIAAAEDDDRSSLLTYRAGATFGVGVGGGHIGCSDDDGDDCDGDGANEAAGLNLRAGLMLSPSLALTGDLWAMAHTEDQLTVSQAIAAAVLRGWVSDRLWLQGGLGVARSSAEVDVGDLDLMSETDYVPAAVAGIGIEVISTDHLALDLELKAGSGLYEDNIQIYNLSLGAGVSFY